MEFSNSVARFVIFGFITLIFAGCDSDTAKVSDLAKQSNDIDRPKIHPQIWPKQAPPLERVEAQEKRIAALISQMSLEEKVGQIIQADIGSVSPREVRKYHLGSILNGFWPKLAIWLSNQMILMPKNSSSIWHRHPT